MYIHSEEKANYRFEFAKRKNYRFEFYSRRTKIISRNSIVLKQTRKLYNDVIETNPVQPSLQDSNNFLSWLQFF